MELLWFFLVFLVVIIGVGALYEVRISNLKKEFEESVAEQIIYFEEEKCRQWELGFDAGLEEALDNREKVTAAYEKFQRRDEEKDAESED